MKKLSITLMLAMISASAIADSALTTENPYNLYLGGEIHVKNVKEKDPIDPAKVHLSGVGISGGLKFCDYVGAELGLHLTKRKKYENRYTHQGASLQIMGYIPFDAISLVGGLGFSHVNLQLKNEYQVDSDHRPIPKASIGFMVHITDNIATRYMASWEKTSSLGKKHNWELKDSLNHQLGLIYTF